MELLQGSKKMIYWYTTVFMKINYTCLEVIQFSYVNDLWEELSVTGGPPDIRFDAAVVVYNNKLIVWGSK